MASLWELETNIPPRQTLPGPISAEAAVIGGGMAGLLTAWFLQERGVRTVVLEADRIGGGQTGRTTAKLTSQHGLRYAALIRDHGVERARLYAQANQWAIGAYRALAGSLKPDCGLEECPAFLYTCRDPRSLEREHSAARSLGLPARMTTDVELPFPVKAALVFDGQARFHPLRFLSALAERLTIYEKTKVLSVKGCRIETDRGAVTAEHIIFAAHYPFVNFPGWYFLRMHQERSFVVALENAQPLQGMYYGVDQPCGLSLRAAGKYLLLGGGSCRTGDCRAGGQYAALEQAAGQYWSGCQVAARWSAQDCIPLDGVPYIGVFSPAAPNWYVATGFQKWGMTSSMVAARIISDLVCGVKNPWLSVFSPQRSALRASARQFFSDSLRSAGGLWRTAFFRPDMELAALLPGRGGLVLRNGKKVGAYRDENGELYLVSPKCPHLGCQLEWNPEEKTWDCPCHGSRFDFRGRLLDGPAQSDLAQP